MKSCANFNLSKYKTYIDENRLFLALTYMCEYPHSGVYELNIPKIDLGILCNQQPDITEFDYDPYDRYYTKNVERFLHAHNGNQYRICDVSHNENEKLKHPASMFFRVIEEKPREMTLSEIEEKLGFKIKIVNEKKE